MPDFFEIEALTALVSVVAIDVALAGDNAIVVGMVAAGVPEEMRRRVIVVGIAAAAVMRIAFAGFTVELLRVVGLALAGGLLLLWVSWKFWREIRRQEAEAAAAAVRHPAERKTFLQAVGQIVVADLSMSLDNVLGVAGAARDHAWVLVVGLTLSVGLMGLAANFIAKLLTRHRWLSYVGLVIILWVSLRMIWDGTVQIIHANPGL